MAYKFLLSFSFLIVMVSCRSMNFNNSSDQDYDFKIYYSKNNFLVFELKNTSDSILTWPSYTDFPLIIEHPPISVYGGCTYYLNTLEPNEIYKDSLCLITWVHEKKVLKDIHFQHRHFEEIKFSLKRIRVKECKYKKEKISPINVTTIVKIDSVHTTILIFKNVSRKRIKLNGKDAGKLIFKIYHKDTCLGYEEMPLTPKFVLKPDEDLSYTFDRSKYSKLVEPKETRFDLEIKSPLNSDKFPKIEF